MKTIKNGRPGTVMPAWGAAGLGDDDISQLVKLHQVSESKQEDLRVGDRPDPRQPEVLVDEEPLPAKPTHKGNLDNLLLVTERESRRIAVHRRRTSTRCSAKSTPRTAPTATPSTRPTTAGPTTSAATDGCSASTCIRCRPQAKVKVGLDSRGDRVVGRRALRDRRQLRACHGRDPGRQDAASRSR